MLIIEEFRVEESKIDEMHEHIKEAFEIIKDWKLPYLEYAKAYQDPDDPSRFRTLFEIGDRSNFDPFNDRFMAYKDGLFPKRFFSIVNEEDYSYSIYNEVDSVGEV